MAFQDHDHQLGPGLPKHLLMARVESVQPIAKDGPGLVEPLPGGVGHRDASHAAGAREPLQELADMAAAGRLGQHARRDWFFRPGPNPVGVCGNGGQRRQSAESSSPGNRLAFHGSRISHESQPGEGAPGDDCPVRPHKNDPGLYAWDGVQVDFFHSPDGINWMPYPDNPRTVGEGDPCCASPIRPARHELAGKERHEPSCRAGGPAPVFHEERQALLLPIPVAGRGSHGNLARKRVSWK